LNICGIKLDMCVHANFWVSVLYGFHAKCKMNMMIYEEMKKKVDDDVRLVIFFFVFFV